jgi:hypothetical protein
MDARRTAAAMLLQALCRAKTGFWRKPTYILL